MSSSEGTEPILIFECGHYNFYKSEMCEMCEMCIVEKDVNENPMRKRDWFLEKMLAARDKFSRFQNPHSSHIHSLPAAAEKGNDCVICMDNEKKMIIVVCGHYCMCENCSKLVLNCPVCRKECQQKDIIKVYDS